MRLSLPLIALMLCAAPALAQQGVKPRTPPQATPPQATTPQQAATPQASTTGSATSAGVSLLTAGDGSEIAAILQQAGYRAQLERTDAGAPRIRTGIEGINYTIAFLGCNPEPCTAIMFTAAFRMDNPPDMAAVNTWNRTRNIGAAYLENDGLPGLIFVVPVFGGISRETFDFALESWRIALRDFARDIGFR
jgi:uncharacterized SAM-binding protein YcdF (DUF218 family)